MILRALALAGGVTGAAGLSQFPEFSQQYAQRLGGAVDELTRQINRYESDAAKLGLSLDKMLDALAAEGPLSKTQARNMTDDITRRDQLAADLAALENAGPFTRARMVSHMGDRDIAKRAFDTFKPAIPATFEGAVFAGTGFVAGWLGIAAVITFLAGAWHSLRGLLRKRKTRTG